jgi:hypothetical protein
LNVKVNLEVKIVENNTILQIEIYNLNVNVRSVGKKQLEYLHNRRKQNFQNGFKTFTYKVTNTVIREEQNQ